MQLDRLHARARRWASRVGVLRGAYGKAGPSRELETLRTAPPHIISAIQRIDPRADLWYVGRGRWRLCTWHRPIRLVRVVKAIENNERLLKLWDDKQGVVRANPGAFWRLLARYEFWIAVYRGGFRPIGDDYRIRGEPTGFIVDDFRQMDWHFRHLNDNAVEAMLNAEADAKIALGDPNSTAGGKLRDEQIKQALDVYHSFHSLSHLTTNPDLIAVERVRSGFTRHPRPATVTEQVALATQP